MTAGAIGSLFTASSVGSWYAGLEKPFFNPPSWIFAPVWTALYILMGISVFLVWRQGSNGKAVRIPLAAFIVQLVLNSAWSWAFFGLRSTLGGLIVIVLLCQALVITQFLFYRVSKPAAILLVPYILWVGFATVLNAALFYLNL